MPLVHLSVMSDYSYGSEWLGLVPDEAFLKGRRMRDYLPLAKARETNRISEFVAQEEARGVGPIDRAEFDGAVTKVVKERPPKDRTSRSASGGNSSGKKTRRGTGPDVSN
jgi:hypothetical protein